MLDRCTAAENDRALSELAALLGFQRPRHAGIGEICRLASERIRARRFGPRCRIGDKVRHRSTGLTGEVSGIKSNERYRWTLELRTVHGPDGFPAPPGLYEWPEEETEICE